MAIALVTLAIYKLTSPETVRRAAFDIGSGSIKFKVADVNPETRRIVRMVDQASRKADFKESIARTPGRRISQAVAAESTNILRELMARARELGATEFAAVGTQAFHQASNGMEYFQRLQDVLGIPATVITHEQQAMLGYLATQQHFYSKPGKLVVWDIGAASMEMVVEKDFGGYDTYLGTLASVGFKNYIIEKIQGKSLSGTQSPNPLSMSDVDKGLAHVMSYARAHVPDTIKASLKHPDTRVIGIGPVHAISILGQVRKELGDDYTRKDLRETLERRMGMTDAAVGGAYANVQIANLILVLGFMEELGIEKVTPAQINLADGLLVADQLWD